MIRSRRVALRASVLIMVGGLSLAFLSAAGTIFVTLSSRDVALRDWGNRLQSMSRILSAHATQTIGAADIALRGIDDSVTDTRIHDAEELRWVFGSRYGYDLLREAAKAMPQVDVITISAADGSILNNTRQFPPSPANLVDRDYFQAHLADPSLDLYISRPVRNRFDGAWTFYLSRKIRAPSGEMLGLVITGLRCAYFESFYESVGLGVERISLIRTDGSLLAQHDADSGNPLRKPHALAYGALQNPQPRNASGEIAALDSTTSLPIGVRVVAARAQWLREWEREASKLVLVGGTMTGLLILATTILARLITQLEAARNAALGAVEAKTRFASNVSHELRTPMNAIIGGAHQLMDTDLAPQSRRIAHIVSSAANQLMILINDILDFSYYEARNFRIEPAPFEIREAAASALDMARSLAPDQQPVMTCTVTERTPAVLLGDASRFSQILLNLLSNAIKYGGGGAISLEIDYESGTLMAVVADTGPGISVSDAQRVFEPFERGKTTMDRPGTGLGLTICKTFAEAMGGSITLQSSLGWGARFCVHLPMPEPPPGLNTPGAPAIPAAPRFLDVLVAEDVAPSRVLLTAMLEKMGHRVIAVENGRQAVDQVRERPFDLILMDLQMPELDGVGATRLIRSLGDDRNSAHIIAVSANVDLDGAGALVEAGFNDTMLKPVTPARLEFMMAQIMLSRG